MDDLLSMNEGLSIYTSIFAGQNICVSTDNSITITTTTSSLFVTSSPKVNTYQIEYTVKNGDTCTSIAKRFCLTIDELINLNNGLQCYQLMETINVTVPFSNAGELVSREEFERAFQLSGYPIPSAEKYQNFIASAAPDGCITTKRELAMFLAQLMWESGGLQFIRELDCVYSGCPTHYITEDDYPNQRYYGRGYIQLTWAYNYKDASLALYDDLRLYTNPEMVAQFDSISWAVSFWYWKEHVHYREGIADGYFGVSTMGINGFLECLGPYDYKARRRFDLYSTVLKAFNINETPIEAGCY